MQNRNFSTLSLLVFLALGSGHLQAQDHADIMAPIRKLFKGMKEGDSAMVHSAFGKKVTLVSMGVNEGGKAFKRHEELEGFLKAVGTPHTDTWNEPIWDTQVQVDGPFAQVWVQYAFYLNRTFSHCGVDAFHLYKEGNEWKIFHLADTRRKEGCQIPREISDQFK